MICLSCDNNLKLLDTFRNVCLQNDKTSKLRFNQSLEIKTEDIFLEDLVWEDESQPTTCKNSLVTNEVNEQVSSALERNDSEQDTHLFKNINSPQSVSIYF